MNSDLKPVATGNWGCGERNRGNPQLKLVIQWMAASVAGLPILIYYTAGNEKLAKVCIFSAESLIHMTDYLPFSWIRCVVSFSIGNGPLVSWHPLHYYTPKKYSTIQIQMTPTQLTNVSLNP